MPPSQKKKNEPAALLAQPWHPNFRNYDRLPDIKVVRTAFFLNMAAISATMFLLAFVCFREYQLSSIQQQIVDVNHRIERDTKANDQALKVFKEFQDLDSKVEQVGEFVKSKPLISPILLSLSRSLPSNLALSGVEITDKSMTLRGVIRGSSDYASGIGTSYQAQLHKDPVLSRFYDDIVIRNMARSGLNNRISFEIVLKSKTIQK